MQTITEKPRKHPFHLIGLSLIAVLVSTPVLVQAQDDVSDKRVKHQRILNKFDHDGDGSLNARESYHARKFHQRWEQSQNADNNRPHPRRVPARPARSR